MVAMSRTVFFAVRSADQNVIIPIGFIIPHVENGKENIFTLGVFNKARKRIVIAKHLTEFPIVLTAKRAKIVYIFRLKRDIIFARINAGTEFVM